jgi:hypothetical protein
VKSAKSKPHNLIIIQNNLIEQSSKTMKRVSDYYTEEQKKKPSFHEKQKSQHILQDEQRKQPNTFEETK